MRAKDVVKDKTVSMMKHSVRTTGKVSRNVTVNSFKASMRVKSKFAEAAVQSASGAHMRYGSTESKFTRQAIGRSTSLARFGYRSAKTGSNLLFIKRHHKRQYLKGNNRAQWKSMSKEEKSLFVEERRIEWKNKGFRGRNNYFKEQGLLKGITGYKPMQSIKTSARSHSRMVTSTIESQNDISAKATVQGARYSKYSFKAAKFGMKATWKTFNSVVHPIRTMKKIGQMVTSFLSALGSMIASIPGIIASMVAMLPVIVVVFLVIGVISMFDDLEYTGRVRDFVENETYYEYRYTMSVHPDEILAITDALNWSTNHKEDYEKLFAILAHGKEGDQLSFEEMLDRVFNTYNPANYSYGSDTIQRAYSYNWLIASSYHWETLKEDDYYDIYPDYKKLEPHEKIQYGTTENIESLKQKARDALHINAHNYVGVYFITNSEEAILSNPIPDDVPVTITDIVGHRTLTNSFHAGDDFAVAEGTPLLAVHNAEVVSAIDGYDIDASCLENFNAKRCASNGGGNQVTLRFTLTSRNGDMSYVFAQYFHMQKGSVNVSVGDKVKAGDVIGKASTTGQSTGTHLHLQMWVSDKENLSPPYKETNSWNANGRYLDSIMMMSDEYRDQIKGRK